MTVKLRGAATQFEQVAKPGFFRIWCGLHQLDQYLKSFFKTTMDEQFYSWLTGFISYLCRQHTLITKVETRQPEVADTRWESMSKLLYSIFIGILLWTNLILIRYRKRPPLLSGFKDVGPLTEEAADNFDPCLAVLSEDRKYWIQLSDATAVLEDLGTFVID
ncbi:hypothetical protein PsorP6_014586 [Peronosclerospora sorghi]|uniref:Uncharacterized protein n=1 Tax=Peronosclerospora sorghi TaxID=230839 RepID=A0ACC0VUX1_9STRA|nr:hypothetical protein PsorP6_014586 [Peronosclerospora sorghi]